MALPRVYKAQLSAIGCSDAPDAAKGQEVDLSCNDFNSDCISPDRLRKAKQEWAKLMRTVTASPPRLC